MWWVYGHFYCKSNRNRCGITIQRSKERERRPLLTIFVAEGQVNIFWRLVGSLTNSPGSFLLQEEMSKSKHRKKKKKSSSNRAIPFSEFGQRARGMPSLPSWPLKLNSYICQRDTVTRLCTHMYLCILSHFHVVCVILLCFFFFAVRFAYKRLLQRQDV